MAVRGEATHVHANFRDDQDGELALDAWDRVQESNDFGIVRHRSKLRFDLCLLLGNLFIQKIEMDQQVGEEITLGWGDLPNEGAFEFGAFLAQHPLRQFGECVRIGLTRQQLTQDDLRRNALDITDDRTQLKIGAFKDLSEAIGEAGPLLQQPQSVAREVAQGTLVGLRDETALEQPMLH